MELRDDFEAFFRDEGFYGAIGMHNLSGELFSGACDAIPVAGYHVLLTEPYLYHHPGAHFQMREYELLTARLSARLWKRYNGPVFLVTDETGYQYIKQTELFAAYDEVLPVLNRRNFGIHSHKYWASGKLQALTKISAPCALIDMDLMIWRPLGLAKYPLAAAHVEHLTEYVYPPLTFFRVDAGYSFPDAWDWSVEPFNTSVAYFADEAFKKYYASESIRFMQAEKETPDNGTICMVFAEQRIFAMCAAEKGIPVHTFLDYDHLSAQDVITHTWSAKGMLRGMRELEEIYNSLCREKLRQLEKAD